MRARARAVAWALVVALPWIGASCKEAPVVQPEPLPTSAQDPAPSNTMSSTPEVGPLASAAEEPSPTPETAGTAPTTPLPPGITGESVAKKAEECWASATCSLDEAGRLFLQADDAGTASINCFRFYYGIGVPANPQRARRCFQRSVQQEKGCNQESPSFDRIYLAAMLLDGQGGPRALDQSKAILAGCFEDASVEALRDEITKREAGEKPGKVLDFCEDIGGTTLSMRDCALLDESRGDFEEQKINKALAAQLDAEGRALAKKAADAWLAFADKEAWYWTDIYRNGSLRYQVMTGRRSDLSKQRRDALRTLFDYALGNDDPAAAEKDLDKEYRAATAEATDAENRKELADAQSAWRAYRTAELAFYKQALKKKLDPEAVAKDLRARLARARIAILKDKMQMEH